MNLTKAFVRLNIGPFRYKRIPRYTSAEKLWNCFAALLRQDKSPDYVQYVVLTSWNLEIVNVKTKHKIGRILGS